MAHTTGTHTAAHGAGAAKDPYAAVWKQAESSLTYRIHAVHDTGVTVDRSRHHLHWQGAAADRFVARARKRHEALHLHNDDLRHLLSQIRRAAEMGVTGQVTAATTTPQTAPVAAAVAADPITDPAAGVDPDADPDDGTDATGA